MRRRRASQTELKRLGTAWQGNETVLDLENYKYYSVLWSMKRRRPEEKDETRSSGGPFPIQAIARKLLGRGVRRFVSLKGQSRIGAESKLERDVFG